MTETLVSLDLSALLRGDGAEAVGLRRISNAVTRLREVQERAAAQLPVSLPADPAALQQIAEEIRARAEVLVIAGQPGGLRAVKALIGQAPNVRYISTPSEAVIPEKNSALLLLEGPPWADRFAERTAAEGIPVAVAGLEPDEPPDGWWFADPSPGDGRLGALNPGSLVAAAFAGMPVEAVLTGAREMQSRCSRAGFFDNPGASWGTCIGMALRPADPSLARTQLLHLVSDPSLSPLADYAARSAMAVLSGGPSTGSVRAPFPISGRAGLIGDEEEMAGLGGARDRMVTLWTRRGIVDGGLLDAVKEHCVQSYQPTVSLRLLGDSPEVRGAALFLVHQAICVAAAWLAVDPGATPAREGWRHLLVRRTG